MAVEIIIKEDLQDFRIELLLDTKALLHVEQKMKIKIGCVALRLKKT
jgi:hypothetical protein